MSLPNTLRYTQLYIKIEDDASPATFSHPCLINAARGINFRSGTSDANIADCSNPDDPAWRLLLKQALSVGITGSGKMDATAENVQFYTAWWKSDGVKAVQVWLGTLGYWQADFKLTDFNLAGDTDYVNVNLTLESHGIVADFTAA